MPKRFQQDRSSAAAVEATDYVSSKVKKLQPVIIAAVSIMFLLSASGLFLSLPSALTGHVDFRTFYTVGYMARTGHGADIHDSTKYQEYQHSLVGPSEGLLPFNHLAYESLLYVPFSFFPYRIAYLLFLCANLVLLWASARLLSPLVSTLSEIWTWLPLALVVSFLPVAIALIEGQDSLLLLLLFVTATAAFNEQNDFKAGVLLGLSLFKFQYAIPVALLLISWRRWKFFRGFALSGAIVVALSVWVTGFSGVLSFVHSIFEVSAKYSSANGVLYGVHPDGMPNFRGFSYMITRGSVSASNLITICLSAISMILAALKRPWIPGALLAALLVSYHQVIADSTLLIVPIGLILSDELKDLRTLRSRFVTLLACAAIIGPTVLLFANTRFYLLALPVTGLFLLWDTPSLNTSGWITGVHNRRPI
jgi:hypothetical protein